jgi:hypothetical protein
MRVLRAVGAFAAVALLTLSVSSQARAAQAPGATLHLAWSAGVSQQVYTATITCSPNGGGEEAYMDVDAVCAHIAAANGNFEALAGYGNNCEHYRGWTIQTMATGNWFGRTVNYTERHSNMCEARKATGPVFAF